MKYFAPAVRALCERVRRPNMLRLLAGLAVIVPAVMLENRIEEWKGPAAADAAVLPALVIQPTEEALSRDPVFEAWRAKAKMPLLTPAAAQLAREYKISEPLAAEIHQAAVANGISPKVAFGLVRAESSFRSKVVSPVGAIGLTQLMPSTARWLEPGITRRELMEPGTNLRVGFRYLRQLIDDYDGNTRLALTAFNRGPGTVNKLLKRGRNPDNGYADKVITGRSTKHVALMNAKFGPKKKRRAV
jgi:soluble lytic murein transglycosylase-like protein